MTRDREPCAAKRKAASAWPPRGAELPGREGRPAHRGGEAPGGKTKLVCERLKGGLCVPKPAAWRWGGCESLMAWGRGAPSCPRQGGPIPTLV